MIIMPARYGVQGMALNMIHSTVGQCHQSGGDVILAIGAYVLSSLVAVDVDDVVGAFGQLSHAFHQPAVHESQ
jgi:hypothetical protein